MPRRARSVARLLALAASTRVAGATETRPPAAADLVPQFQALQAPVVSGAVDAPPELQVGRATIRPASGARLLVLSAMGRACGLVLDGPAQLRYRVEDRFSIPLATRTLRRASGLQAERQGDVLVLTGALKGMAVWGFDLDLPSEPGAAPKGAMLPEWLQGLLKQKLGANPARDMLTTAWNEDRGFRWAALRGAGDDFVLEVDPRPSVRLERLMRWHELDYGPERGRLTAEELVAQPTSGAWWDPPAVEFATVESDLKLVNDAGEHATVTATLKLSSLRDGLRLVPLLLTREVWDTYGQRREVAISKLSVDGEPAPYVQGERGDLLVGLPGALASRRFATLQVVASGAFLVRPADNSYWRLGYVPWYPKPGGIGLEWSKFRIDARVRAPFVPLAAGTLVTTESDATGARVVTTLEGPMEAAVVVAGKYSTLTEERDGQRVHVSTYAFTKDSEARALARNVLSMCECLERWLGVPYPFPELRLIEMAEWGWGQAPPGVIFITKEAFLSNARSRLKQEESWIAAWASRGINERIAHEVAHGFFPHVAKVLRIEENWLSESFADYTSAVCLERLTGDRGQARYTWERQLGEWKDLAKHAGDGASVYLAAHLSDSERDLRTWYDLHYGKGPLVLHALRRELAAASGSSEEGDRLFFTWVRSYVKNFANKPGETRNLVRLINQMTRKDWQPWFERYVYGTETPALR
jgi:hypothetical protein